MKITGPDKTIEHYAAVDRSVKVAYSGRNIANSDERHCQRVEGRNEAMRQILEKSKQQEKVHWIVMVVERLFARLSGVKNAGEES